MPALEAGTHATTGGAGRGAEGRVLLSTVAFAWMAGSSPAMTEGSEVAGATVVSAWMAGSSPAMTEGAEFGGRETSPIPKSWTLGRCLRRPQSGKALRYDGAALKDVDLRDLRGSLSVLAADAGDATGPHHRAVEGGFGALRAAFGLAIG